MGHALDENCRSTSDCDVGLHCRDKYCKVLLSTEEWGCADDYDCQNNLGCYFSTSSSTHGWCLAYMSISDAVLHDCKDYTHRLCKALTCVAVDGFGYGVCSDAFASETFYSSSCDSNQDCPTKNNRFTLDSDCACGFSSKGNSYCRPTLGDSSGSSFRSLLKYWYDSEEIKHCHSMRREASSCLQRWEYYDKIMMAYYGYYWGVELHDNKPCVKSTLTADYWKVYQDSAAVLGVWLVVVGGLL